MIHAFIAMITLTFTLVSHAAELKPLLGKTLSVNCGGAEKFDVKFQNSLDEDGELSAEVTWKNSTRKVSTTLAKINCANRYGKYYDISDACGSKIKFSFGEARHYYARSHYSVWNFTIDPRVMSGNVEVALEHSCSDPDFDTERSKGQCVYSIK